MSQSQPVSSASRTKALGSRENFWGGDDEPEDDLDDLRHHELVDVVREECGIDNPSGDAEELRRLVRATRADDGDDEPTPCVDDAERAAWLAHKILRESSEKHSPIAKHAPPYVDSISDDLEASEVCELAAWFWGGDPDAIAASDRWALHREQVAVEMTEPVVHVPKRYDGEAFAEQDYLQFRHRSRYDPEFGYISGPELADRPFDEWMSLVDAVLDLARSEFPIREETLQSWRSDARALKGKPDVSDEEALATILEEMFESAKN